MKFLVLFAVLFSFLSAAQSEQSASSLSVNCQLWSGDTSLQSFAITENDLQVTGEVSIGRGVAPSVFSLPSVPDHVSVDEVTRNQDALYFVVTHITHDDNRYQ